jgi:hypothetical protein
MRVGAIIGVRPLSRWQRDAIAHVEAIDGAAVEPIAAPAILGRVALPPVPDVIVDFAGVDSVQSPRFGVWRYAFGDGSRFADGAAGTIARLYRIGPDTTRATVLHEGWFRAPSGETRGTRGIGDRVAPWAARLVRRLMAGDLEPLERAVEPTSGCCDVEPMQDRRSRIVALHHSVERWRRRERWTIGLVPLSISEILQRGRFPEPAWLRCDGVDGFYGDPFPIATGGDTVHLLAEHFHFSTGRGALAKLWVGREGELLASGDWKTDRHHLSYPFVLREGGNDFCIPEAAATRRVMAFPVSANGAAASQTVMDGFAAVDSTLVQHDGRWWLFCTNRDDENQTDLYLFFANDWRGPWQAHPFNPVKSDARSSRPAGAFFRVGDVLYRPAQNCARRYGAALSINRIVELTPQRFREEPVLSLAPAERWSWPDGMHTINSVGDMTVVDGLRVER